jgi:hypothetical protein
MCQKEDNFPTKLCPHLETCSIIQNYNEEFPDLTRRFKRNYCYKNHDRCSRRWIWDYLGVESVPELMMPHQYDWAFQILIDSGISYSVIHQEFSEVGLK